MSDSRPKMPPTEVVAQFFARRLGLNPEELPPIGIYANAGATIGALALRMGVLSFDQIDEIIEAQSSDKKRFGELAVHLGFVTEKQVESLVDLQSLHSAMALGELLLMAGIVDVPTLLRILADFWCEHLGEG